MNAAPLWMRIAPYRACDLCLHVEAASVPLCGCPATLQAGRPLPVDQVRAPGGSCGPDATHLVMESWQ
ncbi:MAG: hypothetical protein DI603_15180 [Roseateles depolymerans]|uniref:Uncharacterized protein n=1 Tax=Roseateles depolymerans TaxID=76731 RepID=A0A2W5DL64_9BURK|nr:MAG: hypothetical protein DI603_15180 [Roseateles depolymerans]